MTLQTISRFESYHRNNPNVKDAIEKLALEALEKGQKHKWSVWHLINIIRWHTNGDLRPENDFSISNDFCALYSRLIMKTNARLRDFFDLRPLKNQAEVEGYINQLATRF